MLPNYSINPMCVTLDVVTAASAYILICGYEISGFITSVINASMKQVAYLQYLVAMVFGLVPTLFSLHIISFWLFNAGKFKNNRLYKSKKCQFR